MWSHSGRKTKEYESNGIPKCLAKHVTEDSVSECENSGGEWRGENKGKYMGTSNPRRYRSHQLHVSAAHRADHKQKQEQTTRNQHAGGTACHCRQAQNSSSQAESGKPGGVSKPV